MSDHSDNGGEYGPPYQCDPEIVGNAEGDKRALTKDKAAVAAKRGRRPNPQ